MTHGTSKATTVLVLKGGPDAEREVSLMSGAAVASALRERDDVQVVEHVIDAPSAAELRGLVTASGAAVVFPCLHGPYGEGGPLQAALEAIGVPFVGSSAPASALAMDKLLTKQAAATRDVRTPQAERLGPETPCTIEPPLVLKPIDDGSSVDLVICRTQAEVADARALLHARRHALMAESFVTGREVTVGIVGETPLPVVEIVPAVAFYDYDAKYLRDDTQYVVAPPLPRDVTARLQRDAMTTFRAVGARHLARVDFILADDGPWLLELNTMPGFTSHSLLPMAALHTGRSMSDLCAELVALATADGSIDRSARIAAEHSIEV